MATTQTQNRLTRVHVLGLLAISTFLAIGIQWWFAQQRLQPQKLSWDREIAAAAQGYAGRLAEQKAAAQRKLADVETAHRARSKDSNYLNGVIGYQAREAEWLRRIAFDPALARTALEMNLLQMTQLGRSTEVSARDALAKVAGLAAPRGSRIEVNPMGELFEVKVAFRMSALAQKESGPTTKHTTAESMRREVERLSILVLREIFDSCGTRGIARLQVTCNHALWRPVIPEGATPEERSRLEARAPAVMDRLYRVSLDQAAARSIVDWRRAPATQIAQQMTVEYDGFPHLTINTGDPRGSREMDPNTPLQF